jgi:hypothetical protein
MPLSVSDKLGPYQILAPIRLRRHGRGVESRDARLDRIVACSCVAVRAGGGLTTIAFKRHFRFDD